MAKSRGEWVVEQAMGMAIRIGVSSRKELAKLIDEEIYSAHVRGQKQAEQRGADASGFNGSGGAGGPGCDYGHNVFENNAHRFSGGGGGVGRNHNPNPHGKTGGGGGGAGGMHPFRIVHTAKEFEEAVRQVVSDKVGALPPCRCTAFFNWLVPCQRHQKRK